MPGVLVARHTHPGIESGYVVAGEIDLPVRRPADRRLEGGRRLPGAAQHAACRRQERPQADQGLSTYVVEKGKPLASPA